MATKKPTIESTQFGLYFDDDDYYELAMDTFGEALEAAETVVTDRTADRVTIKRVDYTPIAVVTPAPKVEYV